MILLSPRSLYWQPVSAQGKIIIETVRVNPTKMELTGANQGLVAHKEMMV